MQLFIHCASFLSWEREKEKTNTSTSLPFPRMFITRSLHVVLGSGAQQDITQSIPNVHVLSQASNTGLMPDTYAVAYPF